MSQNTSDKNQAAEERSQETKRFVRHVRAATRRKYTVKPYLDQNPQGRLSLIALFNKGKTNYPDYYKRVEEFFRNGIFNLGYHE